MNLETILKVREIDNALREFQTLENYEKFLLIRCGNEEGSREWVSILVHTSGLRYVLQHAEELGIEHEGWYIEEYLGLVHIV